jgi:lysophospholipase L1-like esterase
MRLRHVLVVLCASSALLGGQAADSSAESGRGDHRPRYYLSLGTSLAVGLQPDAGGVNRRTDEGYADQLHARLQASHPDLRLRKLGCPGETAATMIDGGLCHYDLGSQLAQAVAFLLTHRGQVALITIDLGANEVEPCGSIAGLDDACLEEAFSAVAAGLPRVLRALRLAAGREVPIVGMNYYDPFVVAWLLPPDVPLDGPAIARASSVRLGLFNAMLQGLYEGVSAPVADVAAAFEAENFTPVPGAGGLPVNVILACQWTWMCAPPPIGPNIHGNLQGYAVIAKAFLAVLP